MKSGTVAVAVLLLAACGGGAEKAEPPKAADPPIAAAPTAPSGQAVYLRTCGTCHLPTGLGTPRAVPPLARTEYATGDKGRMIRIALHGLNGPITVNGERYNGVMPGWKALSDAELAAAITYVRSSFGNSADAVSAEDVARERAATTSRTTPYTIAELR